MSIGDYRAKIESLERGENVLHRTKLAVGFLGLAVALIASQRAAMAQSVQSNGAQGMFSEAEKYERFMGRWSRQLAPVFIDFAGVNEGDRVLDVGSGTGALSSAVLTRRGNVAVVGIDPSQAYVNFAASQTKDARVKFQVGDAQKLDFPDASFDRVLSLLVVNFIPDPRTAAAEMRRVTKPGGWVAACVWDYGDGMEMLRRFWDAVVALDPAEARVDERNMPFCRKGQLAGLWRESGFEEVTESELVIEMQFNSFEDYWQPFLNGQGPAGAYIARLGPDRRSELERRLRATVEGRGPGGPFTLKARAWAVKGRVAANTAK